jgi:hypothetical protein
MNGDIVARGGILSEKERLELEAVCTAFDNLGPDVKLAIQREWDRCYHRIEPRPGGHKPRRRRAKTAGRGGVHL